MEKNLNKTVRQRQIGVERATLDWEIRDTLSEVAFALRLKYREKGVRFLGRASRKCSKATRVNDRKTSGRQEQRSGPDAPGKDLKPAVKS